MRPIALRAAWLAIALCAHACRPDPEARVEPAPAAELETQLEALTGAELVGGNALTPVENGAVFDAMVKDIGRARRHVHVLSFIWRGEEGPSRRISEALLRRARGVESRILVDPFGSAKFDHRQEEALKRSGCEVRRYGLRSDARPTARNHRKLVIVDGAVGITGGWGLHTSWEGRGRMKDEWRDSSVRARSGGGADAARVRAELARDGWRAAAAPCLPGPARLGGDAGRVRGQLAARRSRLGRGDDVEAPRGGGHEAAVDRAVVDVARDAASLFDEWL
jgi:cardiolipin synthase